MLIAFRPIHHLIRITVLQDNCTAESIEELVERINVDSDITHDNVNCIVVVSDFPCAGVIRHRSYVI